MPGSEDLILHQYDISPFSEKARLMLGLKGLSWFACIQPVIMPKPDLIALTGGYRQIPVLQIGADLYCGTELIAEELEVRFPAPTLSPFSGPGLGRALAYWTDETLFMIAVELLFGASDFPADEAFVADRTALMGRPFDREAMRGRQDANLARLRAHLDLAERQLADGRAFLLGPAPDMADIDLYHVVDFMLMGRGVVGPVVAAFPRIMAWKARVAAVGHGVRHDTTRERSLEIARDARPAEPPATTDASGPRPGDTISFMTAGGGVATGELTAITPRRLALRRSDPAAGEVVVHLPRDAGVLLA